MMREHENGMVVRWILAPPADPGIVPLPGPGMTAEHVAPHDRGANARERLFYEVVAGVFLAARLPLHLVPEPEREEPLVEALAADSKRFLHALVGTGDEAVE